MARREAVRGQPVEQLPVARERLRGLRVVGDVLAEPVEGDVQPVPGEGAHGGERLVDVLPGHEAVHDAAAEAAARHGRAHGGVAGHAQEHLSEHVDLRRRDTRGGRRTRR